MYKKINALILTATIIYIIIFGIYFLNIGNLEFLWYVGILTLLTILMILLHKKFNFSSLVLAGSSLWGLLHMFGGSIYINGTRLYSYVLLDIYNSNIPEMQILKYDQFMHLYTYFVVTFILFYVIKDYLKKDDFVVYVLLVFMAMGVGAANEIVEFIPVVFFGNTGVGGYYNTLLDIVFNTIGSIVALIYIKISDNNQRA